MGTIRKHWLRTALTVVPLMLALLQLSGWVRLAWLERLDALLDDTRLSWLMPHASDDRIVIVDIDEKSLATVGRWPWSRDHMADLTQLLLHQQQAALVGFDVVFAEPDHSGGLAQLRALAQGPLAQHRAFVLAVQEMAPQLDFDARFANSLQGQAVVLGHYFTSDRLGHTSGQLPAALWRDADEPRCTIRMTEWSGFGASLPGLVQAAPVGGFFNSITDSDGVVRALPLVARFQGQVYPSMALALYQQLMRPAQLLPGFAPGHAPEDGVKVCVMDHLLLRTPQGDRPLWVDERAALLLAFRGQGGAQAGTFRYVSASALLAGQVPAGSFQGKVVLVGTTAPGVVDLRATPIQSVYPGIEMHATALSGLMDGRFWIRPAGADIWVLLATAAMGVFMLWALPRMRAPKAIAFSAGLAMACVLFNLWAALSMQWVLSLAPTLLAVLGIFVLDVTYGYVQASRSRRELVGLFGSYVPKEVVRDMIKDPLRYNMHARSEELTVMFCDLRGFTQMSENMDPLALQQLLNHVFSVLTEIIGRHRGTVDKYMGDCVMAFWGAPIESPWHAELAVKAAVEMVQAVAQINDRHGPLAEAGVDTPISLGIGINTGNMYVGDMGSTIRRSYTVIGDAVNLASRLEGLCKEYGVPILVSESTRTLAQSMAWQEVDRVRVKGKAQAITVATPLVDKAQLSAQQLAQLDSWDNFLHSFRAQDWDACQSALAQLEGAQLLSDALLQRYTHRLAQRSAQGVDPGWDGVTQFESK